MHSVIPYTIKIDTNNNKYKNNSKNLDNLIEFITTTLKDPKGWVGYHNIIFCHINDNVNNIMNGGTSKRTNTYLQDNTLNIIMSNNDRISNICGFDGDIPLSCYDSTVHTIYLNEENWMNETDKFLNGTGLTLNISNAKKLEHYRTYLVLHEVGHSLGYGHLKLEDYTNSKVPIMTQQTRGIFGLPNCWVLQEDINAPIAFMRNHLSIC
jgi:hypothetical protein